MPPRSERPRPSPGRDEVPAQHTRVPRRDPQESERGAVRRGTSALPVAHLADADSERARELRLRQADEATQRRDSAAVERIENPRVLCAASSQYAQPSLGFDLDVAVLEQVFGSQQVLVERALSRRRLSELLSTQRFDIVHLVAGVDSRSGDLVFSDMDLHTGMPATTKVDKLSPAGLANLLAESKTRLVVLATCRALKLAVVLARSLNMVGTEEDITGEQAAEWADCFYNLLRQGQALHKAFDLAASQVDAPLLLVPHRDVVFAVPGA